MKRGAVAIVGAAESNDLGTLPNISAIQLHAESALNALRECGLGLSDIDGIASAGVLPYEVSHYLGITPRWIDGTNFGGGSFLAHVRHAAAAIESGAATTVLVTHGESGRSLIGTSWPPPTSLEGQFEAPYGVTAPATVMTLPALRYLKETGVTAEQMASVAVAQRKWSSQVPRAKMRKLITVDDVLSSPMIAYPFHLLECCLVTDGGGALIITSADRANDFPTKPVYVLGSGEAGETALISQMRDLTSFESFRMSSAQAFAQAQVTHADVDHLMIYDAFAYLPLYGLEDLGFVGRGEAGAFVEEGHTQPGGQLPMNTNGGGLSYTHTGMYGMFAIQEAVRQIRGEAAAQVPDVNLSFVQAPGGNFWAATSLVLGSSAAL